MPRLDRRPNPKRDPDQWMPSHSGHHHPAGESLSPCSAAIAHCRDRYLQCRIRLRLPVLSGKIETTTRCRAQNYRYRLVLALSLAVSLVRQCFDHGIGKRLPRLTRPQQSVHLSPVPFPTANQEPSGCGSNFEPPEDFTSKNTQRLPRRDVDSDVFVVLDPLGKGLW